MQPNGVKVRRMDGGIRYQPPTLKCITTLLLDKVRPNVSPNINLYQLVQKVGDKLVDLVEDRVLGLDMSGTHIYSKLCCNSLSILLLFFEVELLTNCQLNKTIFLAVTTPVQHIGCSDGEYKSGLSSPGEVSEFSSTPNTRIVSQKGCTSNP